MRLVLLFTLAILITGCAVTNPLYNSSSDKFKDKYIEYIGSDEVPITTWYHYVTTKKDGKYILRTFYPETKQITSEISYLDKKMKKEDGPSKRWYENGNVRSEGKYVSGDKEGLWKYYHRSTGLLSSQGKYKSDKLQGAWKFFDNKGRLSKKINYVNDLKEGAFTSYDSLNVVVNEGIYRADTIFKQTKIEEDSELKHVRQMPYLTECKSIKDDKLRNECSRNALMRYVYRNLRYPENARRYQIQGKTITRFVVDKNGFIKDVEVLTGLCDDIKRENLRLVINMPSWEPGIQDGEKVGVRYTLPIKYKLE